MLHQRTVPKRPAEKNIPWLDHHGERSLGVSPMGMLRTAGRSEVERALGAQGVAYN